VVTGLLRRASLRFLRRHPWQTWLTVLGVAVGVAVVVAVAAVATGRITGGLDDPVSSLPARPLPEGEVGAAELEQVRFSPALRGYRMSEVDAVLDRLGAELTRRDEVIVHLERRVAELDPQPSGPGAGLPEA
jgi:DivIVA domain-containing protein